MFFKCRIRSLVLIAWISSYWFLISKQFSVGLLFSSVSHVPSQSSDKVRLKKFEFSDFLFIVSYSIYSWIVFRIRIVQYVMFSYLVRILSYFLVVFSLFLVEFFESCLVLKYRRVRTYKSVKFTFGDVILSHFPAHHKNFREKEFSHKFHISEAPTVNRHHKKFFLSVLPTSHSA